MKNLSSSDSSVSILLESKRDITVSWHFLKENWKAFVGTEVFAVVAAIILLLGTASLIFFLDYIFPFFSIQDLIYARIGAIVGILILALIFIVFYSFLACQYGLAYDIFSSGDMFAEFKGSFTYFRKYWFQYSFLTILLRLGAVLFEINYVIIPLRENILRLDLFIQLFLIIFCLSIYIWTVFFVTTFPSITAQGSLKRCLIENFQILFKHPKRLFITWGLFSLIFQFPIILLISIATLLHNILVGTILWFLMVVFIFSIFLITIICGAPMIALISTRIYTTVELD